MVILVHTNVYERFDLFILILQDEQAMYLYTLENERFMVSLVNCDMQGGLNRVRQENNLDKWEIVRALKCE